MSVIRKHLNGHHPVYGESIFRDTMLTLENGKDDRNLPCSPRGRIGSECDFAQHVRPVNSANVISNRLLNRRRVLVLCGRLLVYGCLSVGLLQFASTAQAQQPTGREILDRVETLLWGHSLQGEYEMSIKTPGWQRTLDLRVWMERPGRSFVRILSPAKEAGIGSLRIGEEMWNYLPKIERTIRIPPSMMLQPWMGSDFTNDDLVKESSILDDYTHRVLGVAMIDGEEAYQVEAIPKPQAAVVWGRVLFIVRKRDFMPLKQEFFSERGEQVRVLSFSDVRKMGGRSLPTLWEMRPTSKPGNVTTLRLKDVLFDVALDASIFSQRRLQRP
ncbi:MAG: outer membrane lipoprotein-sorting protein [Rhodocyclaceae bacterium]|nr:outer membrane lipoprotein-sorting protein [Rhodocyclaceae bacterium]